MDEDGGMSKYPGNKAGAAYGTGYCDAQCPNDTKMINGEANLLKSAQICSHLLKSAQMEQKPERSFQRRWSLGHLLYVFVLCINVDFH